MKNGNHDPVNGVTYRREPRPSNQLLALLNSPLRGKSDSAETASLLSSPEDFERAAQAAWIVQQTNNSQVIH